MLDRSRVVPVISEKGMDQNKKIQVLFLLKIDRMKTWVLVKSPYGPDLHETTCSALEMQAGYR